MKLVENSAIAALSRGWRSAYQTSYTKKLRDAYAAAPDPAMSSIWHRFLAWIETLLGKAAPACSGGLIDRIANSASLKRWFMFAFAMYLPIEYVLRDVLKTSVASFWEEAFIAIGLALVIWRTLTRKCPGSFSRATTLEVALLLYMAVGLLLVQIVADYPAIAFAGWRAQYEYILWFFIMIRLFDDREDARLLLYAFLAAVSFIALHGIYQYIIGVPIPANWVAEADASVRTRVFSITGSPNILGSLMILAAPTAAALIYYCEKPRAKIFFFCVTGIICLCDLFTFSRGSWVGLVAAVILFALFVDARLLIAMLGLISAILIAVPTIAQRLAYLFTNDYTEAAEKGGRSVRWATGLDLLHENSPWLGFGLGRFGGAVAMNNKVLDETEEFSYFYMDNYYMKTLVETGYLGLIAFILCLAVLVLLGFKAIYRAGRGYKTDYSKDPLMRNVKNDQILCVGVFCGLAAVLVHCYWENIFEEPYMMAYFWSLAAVLLILPELPSRKEVKYETCDRTV